MTKAWGVYLLCSAGCLLVWWQLLGWMRLKPVRLPLWLLSAGVLLTPVGMPGGQYAPAVMGAAIQLLDNGFAEMMALLETPLLMGGVLVLGWGLWVLSVWGLRRYRACPAPGLSQEQKQETHDEV